MKKLLFLSVVALGFSCSAPKQYYMYHPTNSNDVKKGQAQELIVAKSEIKAENDSPILLDDVALETQLADVSPIESMVIPETSVNVAKEEYKNLSRTEKKEFRKEVKTEIKNYVKAMKSANSGEERVEATKDLQLTGYTRIGAILAAAGIVLMILTSGTVAQLGALLVLVGVIFVLIDIL